MNIWNPGLNIAYHYSLSQAYSIQPENFKSEPYTKYKLMYYLKYKYVPAFNDQGLVLLPPTRPSCSLLQLLSCSEQAIECVRKLVIEKEKNQTEDIQTFWDTKMICPLTKTAFYCSVSDRQGHLFEKSVIETHLKSNTNCPLEASC